MAAQWAQAMAQMLQAAGMGPGGANAAAGGAAMGGPGMGGGGDVHMDDGDDYSEESEWEDELGADAGGFPPPHAAPMQPHAAPQSTVLTAPAWVDALQGWWKAHGGGAGAAGASAPKGGLGEALKGMGEALGMPVASGLDLEAAAPPAGSVILPLSEG